VALDEVEIEVPIEISEDAVHRFADKLLGQALVGLVGVEAGAVVDPQLSLTRTEARGATAGEPQIEVAIVVYIAKRAVRTGDVHRRKERGGFVAEETLPIVDQQPLLAEEIVGNRQVEVAIVVDIAELDIATVAHQVSDPGDRLVGEGATAVVDHDADSLHLLRRGESAAVSKGEVEIAVTIDIRDCHLTGVFVGIGEACRADIDELLAVYHPGGDRDDPQEQGNSHACGPFRGSGGVPGSTPWRYHSRRHHIAPCGVRKVHLASRSQLRQHAPPRSMKNPLEER